jgi:hypothetical protein
MASQFYGQYWCPARFALRRRLTWALGSSKDRPYQFDGKAMATDEITDRQIAAFKRFITRLPHGKDVDLVILKAHLLIEEEVNAIISARLKNPEVLLGEERFESTYRIRLAQSFFDHEFQPWLWKVLVQLNKLRNRVAHNIDPKGREDLMTNIIETVPNSAAAHAGESLQESFEFVLWILHEAVSSLVEA